MFKRILIANRGEIACRIIRTARKLGVETVAVCSDADCNALHVEMADRAICLGAAPAAESYLDINAVVAAAQASGAEAIHPGYGFLSESPALPEACAKQNITFIGPTAETMRKLGLKDEAKHIAIAAGVPVVPGYFGTETGTDTLRREAARTGFPLMVKAVAGGGGRGMRIVRSADELTPALESAAREAGASFGDSRLMLEKLVENPRHIEVQVFGDRMGNVVHLYERDCSLQRRHQKVIEEAPAPGMSAGLRAKITGAAVTLAHEAKYSGAGTVEFLVEGGNLDETAPFYFIEMNTRLQVEHPVTEEITGLDLVEWQLRIAAGEPLPLTQDQIALSGHAIEVRVYAEDPALGFQPSVGTLHRLDLPEGRGLRLETGFRSGDEVTPHYDAMLVKIISSAATRTEALGQLDQGLGVTVVLGPVTNAGFLRSLCQNQSVRAGIVDTGLIGRELSALTQYAEPGDYAAILGGIRALTQREHRGQSCRSWDAVDAFQLGPERRVTRKVLVDGVQQELALVWSDGNLGIEGADDVKQSRCAGRVVHVLDKQTALVWAGHRQVVVALQAPFHDPGERNAGDGLVRAPITGRIAAVDVHTGDRVANGDRLFTVEAMKMEHIVNADRDGTAKEVHVVAGKQVTGGDLAVVIVGDEASGAIA